MMCIHVYVAGFPTGVPNKLLGEFPLGFVGEELWRVHARY